jgi:hypothetical protein
VYPYRENSELSWFEISIKEGVVNRFSVWEKDNAQIAVVHLWNLNPASNATVVLDCLANWGRNCHEDPLLLDKRSVGPGAYGVEVQSGLHAAKLTEGGKVYIAA